MAEKKYISVRPEDGKSNDLVKMTNPQNEFRGTLVTVNKDDPTDSKDVRAVFVAGIQANGNELPESTRNNKRLVDITPHIKLNPVSITGDEPTFSKWVCMPPSVDGKRISMRMRDDGKWIAVVVEQEADEEQEIEEQTIDVSSPKGDTSSLELRWSDGEISYEGLGSIVATRDSADLIGYRLGEEGGVNEGKILQRAASEGGDEPYFKAWKNGAHGDGLCAGDGAQAWYYDQEQNKKVVVEGGVALGKNAKVTKENAVQIGEGENDREDTLKFREWELVDGEGHIPNERIVTDATLEMEGAVADANAVGTKLASVNSKIPDEATSENQLADKEWVDGQIDKLAAYYITN